MDEQVVFYKLSHKYVSDQECIPENSRQVIYYSLAIGHHIGVLDCFNCFLEIPLHDYQEWLCRLPEGNARRKLEGLLKWGEIEINRDHSKELLYIFSETLPQMNKKEAQWTGVLIDCMQQIQAEPALYLMARKRT